MAWTQEFAAPTNPSSRFRERAGKFVLYLVHRRGQRAAKDGYARRPHPCLAEADELRGERRRSSQS
jgi:hypothetical protein